MAMTIEQEIEQLVLKCIALDGLKACPKDLAFLEKYGLKNLYFFSLEYAMEGTDTTVLDSKAKGLIRKGGHNPSSCPVDSRNLRKYLSSRYRHFISSAFPSRSYFCRSRGKSVE